jgi:hypothetical protein
MNISINFNIYHEHQIFFDELAKLFQKAGNKVGIIADLRTKDPYNGTDNVARINRELDFKPDFICLWGEFETIVNGSLWKAQHMDEQDVLLHFDDSAREMKKYTSRWIVKVLNSAKPEDF